ncbi:MAG: esterase [Myxococcaceae bacterium]|nr:esterase [Myxococcaceae bacterium]
MGPLSSSHSRSLPWLCALLVAACSSSADPTPAPTPAGTGAPAPGGTAPAPGPAPTGTGTVTPPGPVVTSVRVHYTPTSAIAVPPGQLAIRGSAGPLSWDKSASVVVAAPGLYTWSSPDVNTDLEVKPLLGDTWSRGPNYHVKAGQTIDIYPHFVAQHGTVAKQYPSFTSTKLPSTRGIWVYLPPTYVENSESRFGVLYMHDAQNLFDPSQAFGGNEWKVDETMDAGAEDGTIREAIVVGVENTSARVNELTPVPDPGYPGSGLAGQYLSMIIDEIKPTIDKDLRTVPAREQTGIMGSSLGGLVSAYAGVHHADVFGLMGAMSPSTWWDNTEILGEVSTTPMQPAKPIRVYVDSGDAGPSNDDVTNTTELAKRYRDAGYVDMKDLLHVVTAGAQHNEIYWAARLPTALHFLLGARPD